MKKLKTSLIIVMILCLCFGMIAGADTPIPEDRQLPRLVDDADLLSSSEADALLAKLNEISERQSFDVVIVTVDSLQGKTATAYADDFYDYNGYGVGKNNDGILFLISMGERQWAISTCGYGIPAFTDAGQAYMVEKFKPYLSNGEYAEAFNIFADLCDRFVTQARNGEPYDVGHMPRRPLSSYLWKTIVVGIFLGLVVAFVHGGIAKKAVAGGVAKGPRRAAAYVVNESLRLTIDRETYLRSRIVSHYNPPSNSGGGGGSSTHTSSSGTSHGGSSGSF